MKEVLENIFQKYPANKKDKLLPILQDIQKACGYLDEEILAEVGTFLSLPINKVIGVATFYDEFRFRKQGKVHISICKGTSCYLYGSGTYLREIEKQLKVKAGMTSRDGRFSLQVVHCMGACDSSPVLKINETFHTKVTPEELNRLIRSLKEKTV